MAEKGIQTNRLLVENKKKKNTNNEEKRPRGRPRGPTKNVPEIFANRFQKHYFKSRDTINERKRLKYEERKHAGLCVYCGKKPMTINCVFCKTHAPKHKPVIERLLLQKVKNHK